MPSSHAIQGVGLWLLPSGIAGSNPAGAWMFVVCFVRKDKMQDNQGK
jgi:hypothetical protein